MSPVRLNSVTFARERNGETLVMPIPDVQGAPPPTIDWRRIDGTVESHAVAIARDAPVPLIIEVELQILTPTGGNVHVRAIDKNEVSSLGHVAQQLVSANEPAAVKLAFQIPAKHLKSQRVGSECVTWDWELSVDGERWCRFDQSRHPIFVLLQRPVAPWTRTGLWREVLYRACRFADGANDFDDCTAAIASSVHRLGGQEIPVKHGSICIGYNQSAKFDRGDNAYDLAGFLDTAAARRSAENKMNCWDCAGAVSLLSSAVGCDLRMVAMKPAAECERFDTSPVQLIGERRRKSTSFQFHYVNSTINRGKRLSNDVWDACLMLDVDSRRNVTRFRVAAGMPRFAPDSKPGYETQLIAQNERRLRLELEPNQGILTPAPVPEDLQLSPRLDLIDLKAFYARLLPDLPQLPAHLPDASQIRDRLFNEITVSLSEFHSDRTRHELVIARVPTRVVSGYDLHAWLVTTQDIAGVRGAFLEMALSMTAPKEATPGVGDSALLCKDADAILLVRGRTILRLVNDQGYPVDVPAEAAALDAILVALYSN